MMNIRPIILGAGTFLIASVLQFGFGGISIDTTTLTAISSAVLGYLFTNNTHMTRIEDNLQAVNRRLTAIECKVFK